METPATSPVSCVLPSYCSLIAVRDTEPFIGQQPVKAAAIFPMENAKSSVLSSILYPFFCAKLFSARSVSAMMTTATERLKTITSEAF